MYNYHHVSQLNEWRNIVMIYISHPKLENRNGKIRYYVEVKGLEINKLWYEMPDYVEPYINIKDSSPFLVALLPQIALRGESIVVEGLIQSTLYYNITNKLFPLWNKYSSIFKPVALDIHSLLENSHRVSREGHIGTGVSCGVDSFDTIKTTLEYPKENRIDTLTFFNTGSHRSTGGLGYEESKKLFKDRMERSRNCAQELGLNFLWVDSNVGDFLNTKYIQVHQFCNFSAVLACGSYFSKYYYSSGYPLDCFNIKHIDKDTAYYETYLCGLLSTENIDFVISGECKSRSDKVLNISDMPIAQKYLNVCFMNNDNCGFCEKCIRTQMELYAIGKLDSFSNVFDLSLFNKNRNKFLRFACGLKHTDVYRDILNIMEEQNIPIPLSCKIYGNLKTTVRKLKKLTRR